MKTVLFIFYRHDTVPVNVCLGESIVKSRSESNILGMFFDSKLQQAIRITKILLKANKTLNPIKLIRKIFHHR
jgi:hypothetical protein